MSDTQIIEKSDAHTLIKSGPGGQQTSVPHVLPLLPVRGLVVFPGTVMPLSIGRPRSKAVVDEVMPGDKLIAVLTQRNGDVEDPQAADLYPIGVVCSILKLLKLSDGSQSIIVHGLARFRLVEYVQHDPFPTIRIEILDDQIPAGPE